MDRTAASSAESSFFVYSRVMKLSSHAHFWKVFCGFSLNCRAED